MMRYLWLALIVFNLSVTISRRPLVGDRPAPYHREDPLTQYNNVKRSRYGTGRHESFSEADDAWRTTGERYVDGKLTELEERFNRRLYDLTRRLNQSLAIQFLEKAMNYVSEQVHIHGDLLMSKQDDRALELQALRHQVQRQGQEMDRQARQLNDLTSLVANLTQFVNNHVTESSQTEVVPRQRLPIDCEDAFVRGYLLPSQSHAVIQPKTAAEPFKAACKTENQTSWTVIQRRVDGSVSFYRNWNDYKTGFGQPEGEFWLGNEHIHEITNQGDYRLRIEMVTWDNQAHWAEYRHFRISPESDNYRIYVAGFVPEGDAGDSLTAAWNNDHNRQPFSTFDRDNDARFYDNCAQHYRGAWWFRSCFQSHLNGVYYPRGKHSNFFIRNGIQWNTIHPYSSLRQTVMMVRRNQATDRSSAERFSNGIE